MPILLAKHLLINLVLLVMMTEVIRMEETVRFPTLVNCFGPWRACCLSICLYFSLHYCLGCKYEGVSEKKTMIGGLSQPFL